MTQQRYSIYDLLERIRVRPAMYLGSSSISLLRVFLGGYDYAVNVHDIEEDGSPDFGQFHDWTARKFGWYESTSGWDNIILKESGNDEKVALNRFFELLDEFRSES